MREQTGRQPPPLPEFKKKKSRNQIGPQPKNLEQRTVRHEPPSEEIGRDKLNQTKFHDSERKENRRGV